MKYELKTGEGKKGTWYAIIFEVDKYKSEMLFISEIEYIYLGNLSNE